MRAIDFVIEVTGGGAIGSNAVKDGDGSMEVVAVSVGESAGVAVAGVAVAVDGEDMVMDDAVITRR
jgi:hypothetical protein